MVAKETWLAPDHKYYMKLFTTCCHLETNYMRTIHSKLFMHPNIHHNPWFLCIWHRHSIIQLNLIRSADSSNELPDPLTTQTQASEVQASVVTEWLPACLHKLLPRWHQTSNKRSFQLNQYLSYKPHSSFKPPWNFLSFCFCPSNHILAQI